MRFVIIMFSLAMTIAKPTYAAEYEISLRELVSKHTKMAALFSPPRLGFGLGSIISFDKDGNEEIIADPIADRCLDLAAVHAPSLDNVSLRVALPDIVYEEATGAEADANLHRALMKSIDIKGAFEVKATKSVALRFIDPFVAHITTMSASQYYRNLKKSSECKRQIDDSHNLVIKSVFGARGIEYTIRGSDDKNVSFSASLLKMIGIGTQASHSGDIGEKLIYQAPEHKFLLIGYSTWRPQRTLGAFDSDIDLVEMTAPEIEEARKEIASRRREGDR